MGASVINIPNDSRVFYNLKESKFEMSTKEIEGRVMSLVTHDNIIFVAVVGKGILIFRMHQGDCQFVQQLHYVGSSPRSLTECKDCHITCYQISVSAKYLIYIKNSQEKLTVCLHHYSDILDGNTTVKSEKDILCLAPMVIDHELDLLCIGCSAWTVSWTTEDTNKKLQEANESCLCTIDLKTMEERKTWKVVENSVYLLHLQKTVDHNMIGIADSRTGLSVYDLKHEENYQYICLYRVPVEEIRSFHLVGNFVAVFHKFQPNVTFWNMKEQKTILCINIQDQMRELVEEGPEDDDADEDCGLCEEDDDHVTCVTSVQSDDDHLLIYGTKSGCIFGMSVNKRLTLFNIPCPHLSADISASTRRAVQGLQIMTDGLLAVVYEKSGLTVMDFSLKTPPEVPTKKC